MTEDNKESRFRAERARSDEAYLRAWNDRLPTAEQQSANPLLGLGTQLLGEFIEAQLYRDETEQRWLTDLRQYKGQYEPEEEAIMTGSKAFARKTRVKVESVDARMTDMLFPANRERNYSIDATPEPVIPAAKKREIIHALGQISQGGPVDPEDVKKAVNGFAKEAAEKMAVRIDDQLAETKYRKVCREVLHSGHLYGTGVLKGPLVERKTDLSYKWANGKYTQVGRTFTTPFVTQVPIWRWYPDMSVTDLKDARYTWEHHRLSRATLYEMSKRKSFEQTAILNHIDVNPDGDIRLMRYEQGLMAVGNQQSRLTNLKTGQYDVYERWGWLKAEELAAAGVDVPNDRMQETFFSNVWVLPNGEVVKAVLSPINGMDTPYHLYYLDKDETSIFGDGFPSIMRDDQSQINSARRMILDNGAICAGPQFEAFVPAFPKGTDFTSIHPLRVWPRSGGDFQYPAIRPLNFDSHIGELMEMERLFDTSADETTAIPKFTYGDNPTNGAAGTMGGLSMLLGQANIALKDLVANWDEVTKSFITAMYHWNMQFGRDDAIKGDYAVAATGAASLVAKEVRANLLNQFGATLQPEERQFIKWDILVREKAKVQELDSLAKTQVEVDEDAATPGAKMQQQMMQMQQELAMKTMEANLNKLQATIENLKASSGKIAADTEKAIAEAVDAKVKAAYSAMQAAGVIVANKEVAPVGDALLKEAGWGIDQSATDAPIPDKPVVPPEQLADNADEPAPAEIEAMTPDTAEPMSPAIGQEAGIETSRISG